MGEESYEASRIKVINNLLYEKGRSKTVFTFKRRSEKGSKKRSRANQREEQNRVEY